MFSVFERWGDSGEGGGHKIPPAPLPSFELMARCSAERSWIPSAATGPLHNHAQTPKRSRELLEQPRPDGHRVEVKGEPQQPSGP